MIHGIINVYKEKRVHFPRCSSKTPWDRGTEKNSDTPEHLIRMRTGVLPVCLGKSNQAL